MTTVSSTVDILPDEGPPNHLPESVDPPAPHADAENQQTDDPMIIEDTSDREEVGQAVPTNFVIESDVRMAEIKENLRFKDQIRQSQQTQQAVQENVLVPALLVPASQLAASPLYGSDATPIRISKNPTSISVKKRRLGMVLAILIAIALLAAIVGGIVTAIRRHSSNANNSLSPPQVTVRSVIADMYSTSNTTLSSFQQDTPQGRALAWLEDTATTPLLEKDRILVRYALATLFYAMGGEEWNVRANFLSADDHECDWNFGGRLGVSCGSARQVTVLSLPNNSVRQQLPTEISILTDLRILNLQGDIRNRTTLNVQTNALGGTLPTELGALTNLIQLDLSQNGAISGPIPTEIVKLDQLVELRLNDNSLNGTVPEFLGRMPSLTFIALGNNDLTGDAPTLLAEIPCVLLDGNDLSSCFSRRRQLQASASRDPKSCFSYTPPCELPT